jgi:hypothetical protein
MIRSMPGSPISVMPGTVQPGPDAYRGVSPIDYRSFLSTNTPVASPISNFRQPATFEGGLSRPTVRRGLSPVVVPTAGSEPVSRESSSAYQPTFNLAQQYGNVTNPQNYFSMVPGSSTGISPGTSAIGSPDMPISSARNTLNALNNSKNLSPTMLGGAENAGYMVDRLGNMIYSPGAFQPTRSFKEGGAANADEVDTPINTDPLGTAQQFLSQLLGSSSKAAAPTLKSVKRKTASGGAKKSDEMVMGYEAGAKEAASKDSARAQMEELARLYKEKAVQAADVSRGFGKNTFGAPTLAGRTLTKNTLAKKRFAEGGEVQDDTPSMLDVQDYATSTAQRMYPNMAGQDDPRDAARHLLAAATVTRKYGPKAAELLGKAHEYTSNPETFFSMLGIGEPRGDFKYDLHNNQVGIDLGLRATSQAQLEDLVKQMTDRSSFDKTQGRPWIMSQEQMDTRADEARARKAQLNQTPEGYAKGGDVADPEAALLENYRLAPGADSVSAAQMLKGVGQTAYGMGKGAVQAGIGLPGDLEGLARMLAGQGESDTVLPNTRDVKGFLDQYLPSAGEAVPGAEGRAPAEYFGEFMGLPSMAKPAAQAGTTAARMLEDATVGNMRRSKIRKAAGNVPEDAAYDALRERMQSSGNLAYAVRPEGSKMYIDPLPGAEAPYLSRMIDGAKSSVERRAGVEPEKVGLIKDFWDKKATNYFSKQFGVESDPVYRGIADKSIKSPGLNSDFPEYILDQLSVGKTRVKEAARPEGFVGPGAAQERFFPKYPEAADEIRKRYDKMTGIEGTLIKDDPARDLLEPEYTYLYSREGKDLMDQAKDKEIDKMLAQGTSIEQASPKVEISTRSLKNPKTVVGPREAQDMFLQFEKMSKEGTLPQQFKTMADKEEVLYTGTPRDALSVLFDTESINDYLLTVPDRQLKNLRFEDAVRGGAKVSAKKMERDTLVNDIKSGKRVNDKFFSQGVSAPLKQYNDGPFEGFAWKRIEDAEATVPEGAYLGHSVGGYAKGGNYGAEKNKLFNEGKYRVYTLRDNRNRPVNTVEVRMDGEDMATVTQIKGNGRATGNTAPEKYDELVYDFLLNEIKPYQISESDSYLSPMVQGLKNRLINQ